MNRQRRAMSVAALNMIWNILLASVKLTVGCLVCSEALISDGVHGATDVLSAVVVMAGIRLSSRRTDEEHPYGHERMECVAAVLIAVLIGATGMMLLTAGVRAMITPSDGAEPGMIAVTVAIAAVVIKEWMFRYTRRAAEATASAALLADAWHQRVDVLASLGGLVGVVGAQLGMPILDALAGCVISVMILHAACDIFIDAMRKMTDRSCDRETAQGIVTCARTVEGVLCVEGLRTRLFGSCVLAEITVCVDDMCSSETAYGVAQAVRRAVEDNVETVKECTVHIHPIAVANQAGACYNNE